MSGRESFEHRFVNRSVNQRGARLRRAGLNLRCSCHGLEKDRFLGCDKLPRMASEKPAPHGDSGMTATSASKLGITNVDFLRRRNVTHGAAIPSCRASPAIFHPAACQTCVVSFTEPIQFNVVATGYQHFSARRRRLRPESRFQTRAVNLVTIGACARRRYDRRNRSPRFADIHALLDAVASQPSPSNCPSSRRHATMELSVACASG